MIEPIKGRNVVSIYSKLNRNVHYGLQVLFQFDNGLYLYFDSARFKLMQNDNPVKSNDWNLIVYHCLSDGVTIVNIKEDELTSYFLEFSNGDIFFIFQMLYHSEFWYNDFKILSNHSKQYDEVRGYMNEDFVENAIISTC
ncbi:hypothetical protein [Mucilaginibacter lacusdianchii]|uniref:hypothetical protein n=1 Tax=Mucilaginibacter lacusdianchii TaxID=2684211 RepID=UPI00131A6A80|nr:hypothetical protein [Mucilaginibacter sp. JXJ CY 39]